MIKKAFLSLALLTAFGANADFTLNTSLLVATDECTREIQQTVEISDVNVVVTSELADDIRLENKIVSYDQNGAILSFRIMAIGDNGEEMIISEPLLVVAWGQEGAIEMGTTKDGNPTETIRFSVIATRN